MKQIFLVLLFALTVRTYADAVCADQLNMNQLTTTILEFSPASIGFRGTNPDQPPSNSNLQPPANVEVLVFMSKAQPFDDNSRLIAAAKDYYDSYVSSPGKSPADVSYVRMVECGTTKFKVSLVKLNGSDPGVPSLVEPEKTVDLAE